ncbi:UNVERIFIED_CONTAM: hypothetical protein RF653_10025 [Kocuria sp. CPCC 205316]|uniref:phage tail tube protein n=1 Tax=Kocuria TaxID=57493 RepID=UPI0036D8B2C9
MARGIQRGNIKILFCPAVANVHAPTAAELTAGTDITGDVGELDGWTFNSTQIDTPDMATRQTKKIPGPDEAADSSFTLYEDDTTNPLRSLLEKDVVGFVVFTGLKGLTTAGSAVDVFPVQVSGNNRLYSAGNEAARFRVQFSIDDEVGVDATVAA